MRVGIMGGTFDPIHIGHLNAAQEIAEKYALEEIIIVPSSSPPHKKRNLALATDRLKMCQLAIKGNPLFNVSDIEIARKGISYTIDTVREFKRIRESSCEIFFIIGSDAFAEAESWKEIEKLFHECNFIVDLRGGDALVEIEKQLNKESRQGSTRVNGSQFKVYIAGTTPLDISSTLIRKRIAEGRSIKYLIPQKVEDYIAKEGLYGYNRKTS